MITLLWILITLALVLALALGWAASSDERMDITNAWIHKVLRRRR